MSYSKHVWTFGILFISFMSFSADLATKRACLTFYYVCSAAAIFQLGIAVRRHLGAVIGAIADMVTTKSNMLGTGQASKETEAQRRSQVKILKMQRALAQLIFLKTQWESMAWQNSFVALVFAAWPFAQCQAAYNIVIAQAPHPSPKPPSVARHPPSPAPLVCTAGVIRETALPTTRSFLGFTSRRYSVTLITTAYPLCIYVLSRGSSDKGGKRGRVVSPVTKVSTAGSQVNSHVESGGGVQNSTAAGLSAGSSLEGSTLASGPVESTTVSARSSNGSSEVESLP